ncbi:nitroreductase [Streptomyces humidus]|uniref:Nitroreductase n=1 Tax=Streptomyces humidus TaxID=52259 RepID=A0A918GB31_9ACTN|nr:nitroreductase [Streptomyces humidus]GGS27117.1 nitroreductase [Streptomyces humidus]
MTTAADVPSREAQAAETEFDMVDRLLRRRHSCRAFSSTPVPHETLTSLLDSAQRTASWCNVQPWQVVVTSGTATERFSSALLTAVMGGSVDPDIPAPTEYRGAYKARRRESGLGLYSSLGIPPDDHEARTKQTLENFRFFGAPHVLVIHSEAALGPYAHVDVGGYIANLLLAAEALGLAAIPQAAIAMQSSLVHEHFGLGADRVVVAAISLGYEAEHPANVFRTDRADLAEVVTWVSS